MKSLIVALSLCLLPFQATAACVGANLLETMPAAERATLDATVATHPFPTGNHWRATRGESVIDVFGTFHIYDPRMDDIMKRIAPFFETADAVYLEATEAEMTRLQTEMTRNPDLLFIAKGEPTLPERLSEAEWQTLSDEFRARGIAPFIASKFQPWYVTVVLGVPPCAMADLAAGAQGLDKLITDRSVAAGVPVAALESYDTLFRVFDELKKEDELELIRASIATAAQAEDMFATLTEAYFAEDHRLIWEFSREAARKLPGIPADEADKDFALMEDLLLTRRNAAWMDVILPAAEGRRIAVAVGAAHLSGKDGVLNLLQQAGYKLERAPF